MTLAKQEQENARGVKAMGVAAEEHVYIISTSGVSALPRQCLVGLDSNWGSDRGLGQNKEIGIRM